MRNPLTRDRLNAAFPTRPDIVRAFEEMAQVTDTAPSEIVELQSGLASVYGAVSVTRSGLSRLADSVDALAEEMATKRRGADLSHLLQRIEALEAMLHAAK